MTRLATIALALIACAAIAAPHHLVVARKNVAAGGGDSPGTTDLVAWYDFDDATDSHASYDLTETGTPTYGSGIATIESGEQLVNTTVDNNWGTTDADRTWVIRYRANTGALNGQYPFKMQSPYTFCRYYETGGGTEYKISNVNVASGDNQSEGPWYLAITRYNATTDNVDVLVNDAAPTTSTGNGVHAYTGGNLILPDPVGALFSYDFFALYDRRLTDAECTWLYNSGSTREYTDL